MNSMAQDLSYLYPEILVLVTGALALIAEMLRRPGLALVTAVIGLSVATALTLPLLGVDHEVFSATFRIDALSTWGKLIMLPATVAALLLARAELIGTEREGSVYSLICFTTFGALVLAAAGDMMLLVLGVLLSSLGAFTLVAYPRNGRADDAATEAAMKLFVFASVTGGVMIFGLSYWFGATGSTLLSALASPASGEIALPPAAMAFGLVAVIVGLGYKASLAPFHFWAPDAYDGAPLSIAAYLSVVPKIAAIFALAQVVRDLPIATGWPLVIAAVAVLTMTWGYLAALVQENAVRLLAYSSIAQAGYFLLGVVAVGASPLALTSLIIFAAAYAAMNLGAFAVIQRTGRRLSDFTAMGREHPVVGVAMVIFLLSLTGIPPLAGFTGKFLLFGAAIDANYTWLTVIAILNSVLSLAVYLRFVVPMYRQREAGGEGGEAMPVMDSRWPAVVWGFALGATLLIGLVAQPMIGRIG